MTFRISFGPREAATTILTETAEEAVKLVASLAKESASLSIQTLDGVHLTLSELAALVSGRSEPDILDRSPSAA